MTDAPTLERCIDWTLETLRIQAGQLDVFLSWSPWTIVDGEPTPDFSSRSREQRAYCCLSSRDFFSFGFHDYRSWQYNAIDDPPAVLTLVESGVRASHVPGIEVNLESHPGPWSRYRIAAGDEELEIIALTEPRIRIQTQPMAPPSFHLWPDEIRSNIDWFSRTVPQLPPTGTLLTIANNGGWPVPAMSASRIAMPRSCRPTGFDPAGTGSPSSRSLILSVDAVRCAASICRGELSKRSNGDVYRR